MCKHAEQQWLLPEGSDKQQQAHFCHESPLRAVFWREIAQSSGHQMGSTKAAVSVDHQSMGLELCKSKRAHRTAAGSGLLDKKFSCRHVSDELGMLFQLKKRPWTWLEKHTPQKFDEYQSRNIRLLPPAKSRPGHLTISRWFDFSLPRLLPHPADVASMFHTMVLRTITVSSFLLVTTYVAPSVSTPLQTCLPHGLLLRSQSFLLSQNLAATAAQLPLKESITAITSLISSSPILPPLSTYKTGLA